jgi:hypothetical protein
MQERGKDDEILKAILLISESIRLNKVDVNIAIPALGHTLMGFMSAICDSRQEFVILLNNFNEGALLHYERHEDSLKVQS